MSEPVGPGDWVECLRESARYGFRPRQLYLCTGTPERTLPCTVCDKTHRGLTLKDAPADKPATWLWPTCCFRPIYRPKASIIEALKAPVTRTPKVVKPIRDEQKVNAQ